MSVWCLGSVRGSPGATTTALAVAASWPADEGRRVVLVEADADGGVLGTRYGLDQGRQARGLATLAVAIGRGAVAEQLWDHTCQLPGGLEAVVAPTAPDEATGVLRASGEQLGRWLNAVEVTAIVDCGRLSPHSASVLLAVAAERLLVVAQPRLEELAGVAHRLRTLQATGVSVGLVLVGDSPYSQDEVAESLGVEVVGIVDHDPRAAGALQGAAWHKSLRWTLLARSAHSLARELARRDAQRPRPMRSPWASPTGESVMRGGEVS